MKVRRLGTLKIWLGVCAAGAVAVQSNARAQKLRGGTPAPSTHRALQVKADADEGTPPQRRSPYRATHRSLYGVPTCADDSPVVGRSDCKRFGQWSLPPNLPRLQMQIGGSVRVLGAHQLDLGDHAAARTHAFAPDASSGGGLGDPGGAALTFDWQLTGELSRHIYTGVDVSIGAVRVTDPAQERSLGITIGGDRGMYYHAGGVLGLISAGDPLVIRGEVFGGARLIEVPFTFNESGVQSRASLTQAVIEPRVAVELWLSPWVTLGARAGSDVLRRGGYMFGMYFALYGRAFDGARHRALPE